MKPRIFQIYPTNNRAAPEAMSDVRFPSIISQSTLSEVSSNSFRSQGRPDKKKVTNIAVTGIHGSSPGSSLCTRMLNDRYWVRPFTALPELCDLAQSLTTSNGYPLKYVSSEVLIPPIVVKIFADGDEGACVGSC